MTTTPVTGTEPTLLWFRPYWRWSVATQLGRLPGAMAPLAFAVLTTAATGSYRTGAVMMVAFVIGEVIAAIPVGRMLDRVGPARGTRLLLVASAGALLLLAAGVQADLPTAALLLITGAAGATAGGILAGFRSVLAGTVPDGLLVRAVSVDAIFVEGVLISGPVVTVALSAWNSAAPLIGMAVAFLASALVLRAQPTAAAAAAPPDPVSGRGRGSIPWWPALGWLACMFTIGHLLSAVEVGALGLAEREGAPQATAALLIAVLSGASIIGSALFAWRGRPSTATAVTCLGCLAFGGVLVAAGSGWIGLLAGLALVGLCTGPLLSTSSVRLQRVLPEHRRSEGFSVAYVVQSVGFAAGALGVGVLDLGLAVALGATSAALSVPVVLAVARRQPSVSDAA